MPAWFWDTPQVSGGALAVGYSVPHRESLSANDDAFKDAAWRLFCDRTSLVTGERGSATAPDGMMDLGSTLNQQVDSAGFEAFQKHVVRLDSALAGGMRVMLVGTGEFPMDTACIPSPAEEEAIQMELTVAEGSAPIYYYQSSSWQEAEQRARLELALGANAEIKGVGVNRDNEQFKAAVFKTNVRLEAVQTVRRRWDMKNGVVKAWVTGRATQVNSERDRR